MFFWIILLLGLFSLSATLGGLPSAELLTPGHPSRMVYGTVFGTGMIAASALRLLLMGHRGGRGQAGVLFLMIGVVAMGFSFQERIERLTLHMQQELVPSMAVSTRPGEVELKRNWDGHYRAEVLVNGADARLLVDTGATLVLLPFEQAARFGFDPATLDFSMPVTTANGKSSVAPVRISILSIGPIEVQNVSAAIAQPGMLTTGLLGMSFLDALDETSFRKDKLLLRQTRTDTPLATREAAPDQVVPNASEPNRTASGDGLQNDGDPKGSWKQRDQSGVLPGGVTASRPALRDSRGAEGRLLGNGTHATQIQRDSRFKQAPIPD